jgi:hypothetical protein
MFKVFLAVAILFPLVLGTLLLLKPTTKLIAEYPKMTLLVFASLVIVVIICVFLVVFL